MPLAATIDHRLLLLLSFIAGSAFSVVIEEILRRIYRRSSRRVANSLIGRLVLRRSAARLTRIERLHSQWGMTIGRLSFPWVVAGYGPYRPENIESFFSPAEPSYPPEIERSFNELVSEIKERAAMGEEVPYDSDDFKLCRFHVSSRTGHREDSRLVLHFQPTTYYRMLATDQRLDVPLTDAGRTSTLRERYAAEIDLRVAAVPQLATHWGVGLAVVTNDGYLLMSERGNTAVDSHVFFPSVAEGASRNKDSAANGAPDHFSIARRGMEEELGIPLQPNELTWLSFGANSVLCEFGLIGLVKTPFTFDEIERHRSVGVKDAWESARLHGVDFDPHGVVEFCSANGRRFSPFALVAFVHALLTEFALSDVDAAFGRADIAVTQRLPDWL